MKTLFIFGAGASKGCLDSDEVDPIKQLPAVNNDWIPPTSDELFSRKFASIHQKEEYNILAALIRKYSQQSTSSLEKFLEDYLDEEGHILVDKQLLTLRFYLKDLLTKCSNSVHAGNWYQLLLETILRLNKTKNVFFLTFNYDVIFEKAAKALEANIFTNLQDYTRGTFKLCKIHGSVDWSYRIDTPDFHGVNYLNINELYQKDLEKLKSAINNKTIYFSSSSSSTSPVRYMQVPVIAIPKLSKASFECPETQLNDLKGFAEELDQIICIGWKGADIHFTEEIKKSFTKPPLVHVVSTTEENAKRTQVGLSEKLLSSKFGIRPGQTFGGGFKNFMNQVQLKELL